MRPRTASRCSPMGRACTRPHSPEAVVDLLSNGQGVFAIAVDQVWSDLEEALPKAEAEPAQAAGGS